MTITSALGAAKRAIEHNLGWSMVVGGVLGLAFPYGEAIPDFLIIVLLAILIFLSCFRITIPLRSLPVAQPLIFCAGRYLLAPVVLWALCHAVAPGYATGVLLLALCPAAASSAALTAHYHGNVGLAFVISIVSSLACVVSIPVFVGALDHQTAAVSAFALLKTLLFCTVLPGMLYLALRRKTVLQRYSHAYGRLSSVLLLCFLLIIILAKKRNYILAHPYEMLLPAIIGVVFYGLFTALSFAVRTTPHDRVTYGVCSIFNNNALGIGLAVLYFDEKTVALMIATEIIWIFLPLFFEPVVKRLRLAKDADQPLIK